METRLESMERDQKELNLYNKELLVELEATNREKSQLKDPVNNSN